MLTHYMALVIVLIPFLFLSALLSPLSEGARRALIVLAGMFLFVTGLLGLWALGVF